MCACMDEYVYNMTVWWWCVYERGRERGERGERKRERRERERRGGEKREREREGG